MHWISYTILIKKGGWWKLNKKLIYIFAVLVAGLFVVSACEQAIGRRVVNNNIKNDEQVQEDLQVQQSNLGGNILDKGNKLLGTIIIIVCSGCDDTCKPINVELGNGEAQGTQCQSDKEDCDCTTNTRISSSPN